MWASGNRKGLSLLCLLRDRELRVNFFLSPVCHIHQNAILKLLGETTNSCYGDFTKVIIMGPR
jgi:hypothetical protein